jgi:hypothetical protein
MLYLTTKTRQLLSFQTAELSVIECDIFRIFHTPPHLEQEMEMKLVDFFLSGLVCLITRWMLCTKLEDAQLKTLDVIHKRYTHTDRAGRSKTEIHS